MADRFGFGSDLEGAYAPTPVGQTGHLDPQLVAEILASGYDPKALAQIDARRGHQPHPFNTLGAAKGQQRNFLTDVLPKAAFGDPEAKVSVPVTSSGTPMDMNLSPSQFEGEYGAQHPAIDAGLQGGLLATGAPELMSRSLLGPLAQGFKTAAQRAPLATTGATAAAATALPSATGKTPWEVMQENWENRRKDLKGKISDEDIILRGEANKLAMSPAEKAQVDKIKTDLIDLTGRYEQFKAKGLAGVKGQPDAPAAARVAAQIAAANANVDRIQNRGGQIDTLKKQSEGITGPAQERRTGYEKDLAGIDTEIQGAQTPMRQAHPWVAAASLPLAWGAAAKTGNVIGKAFRGGREAQAEKMGDLLKRTEQHVADTSLARGGAAKTQFNTPEGQALTQELKTFEGNPKWAGWNPVAATASGAGVGAAEGLAVPGGFTAADAMLAPGGSPLQESSTSAPLHSWWWKQGIPEMGEAGLAGGLGGLYGSIKAGKGMRFGVPPLPTERVNAYSFAARGAQLPPTLPKPPRVTKPKAAPAPEPSPGGPALTPAAVKAKRAKGGKAANGPAAAANEVPDL